MTTWLSLSPLAPLKVSLKNVGLVALSLLSSPAATNSTDLLPLVIEARALWGSRSCG
jgi:hypothetical protein